MKYIISFFGKKIEIKEITFENNEDIERIFILEEELFSKKNKSILTENDKKK